MVKEEDGEDEAMISGRQTFLDGLRVMDSRFVGGDDEEEELVPGKRVFTGLKFEDEESRATAQRVGYASLALAGLAVAHAVVQAAWRHHLLNTALHLVLGLLLPCVGYRGATLDDGARWRPRLLWAFHVGNVIFVLVHAMMLVKIFMKVAALEGTSSHRICGFDLDQQSGAREEYLQCQQSLDDEKRRAPGLLAIWCLLSIPYWACAVYAAYYCHELYLQLSIRNLTVCRDASMDDLAHTQLATVAWNEADDDEATAE